MKINFDIKITADTNNAAFRKLYWNSKVYRRAKFSATPAITTFTLANIRKYAMKGIKIRRNQNEQHRTNGYIES